MWKTLFSDNHPKTACIFAFSHIGMYEKQKSSMKSAQRGIQLH